MKERLFLLLQRIYRIIQLYDYLTFVKIFASCHKYKLSVQPIHKLWFKQETKGLLREKSWLIGKQGSRQGSDLEGKSVVSHIPGPSIQTKKEISRGREQRHMPRVPAHVRLKDYEFQVYLGYIDRFYF